MKLNPGEVKCNECNGSGEIVIDEDLSCYTFYICSKCNGDGKLDWLENIVGKKVKNKPKDFNSEGDLYSDFPITRSLI